MSETQLDSVYPGALIHLGPDEVHIWCVSLDRAPASFANLDLSADECLRASRFRFSQDRTRFVACRTALRKVLSWYVGDMPAAVQLEYGPYGKPALARKTGTSVKFNVSHSSGLALIALARDYEVGIDVELVRPLPDLEEIAQYFMCACELAYIHTLPRRRRVEETLTIWTQKEAYLKALGIGLTGSTKDIRNCFTSGAGPSHSAVCSHAGGIPKWSGSMSSLRPVPGFVATVVVETSAHRIVVQEYPLSRKVREPHVREAASPSANRHSER